MDFELGNAVVAGLAATAVMTAMLYMGFAMGMKMDMPMMLGTMFLPKGPAAWLLGLMMHFAMGVAFLIVYAALFDAFGLEDGLAGWGALFGLVHGVIAGMAMGMMGMMHPRMARAAAGGGGGSIPDPGLFAVHVAAMAPMAVLVMHVIYGAVGGAIYAV
jgi:hypothetical protein